jgi:ankyrin repeat protein
VPKELIHQDQARIMTVGDSEKGDDGTMNTILELEKHRVVGCGPRFSNTAPRPNDLVRYRSRELASGFESATTPGTFLATQTLIPLKLLYAQDLFTSFMWAVAKELATAVDGGAEVHHHDATGPDAWQSFTLHNNKISSLARTIQNTGLGSLDQIYLSIIPPLSVERKLPEPAKIVELALKHAEPDERVQRWEQAGEKYLWLFRVGMTFPQDSPLAAKATAVLLEHLRVLTGALEAKEALRYEWRVPSPILNDLISSTTKELESAGNIVIQLKELYQEQRRDCTFVPASPSEYDIQVAPNYSTLSDLVPDGGFLTWGLGSDRSRDQVVVNQRDAHNWTRLHYFAARGLRFNSELLLRHRADVNARDLFGWTPLHQACCHGEASVVQLLLLEGAEPDLRGSDGLAPLHCAAMNDNIDVLKKLLEAGASPDVLDAAGNTPLHWAAYRGCLETVKYLLVDRKTAPRNNWGRTPLHLAAAAGRVDVVRYLVSIVAIGAADRSGWTPLHCAATCGDVDVSRALIEAGADVKAKSKADLQTPLHFASEMGMMLLSNT